MYFNTTNLTHSDLQTATGQAKKQDELVLNFFKDNPKESFSPDDVHKSIFQDRTPLTSVRRSVTNLTKEGHLEKTDIKKRGSYGKLTYTWKLKTNGDQITLF